LANLVSWHVPVTSRRAVSRGRSRPSPRKVRVEQGGEAGASRWKGARRTGAGPSLRKGARRWEQWDGWAARRATFDVGPSQPPRSVARW